MKKVSKINHVVIRTEQLMKYITTLTLSAILLIHSQTSFAQTQNDLNVLLSAAAGAAIGSTIGEGDGKKIATVVGGLIGAEIARDQNLYSNKSFKSYCRDHVPAQYRRNSGVANSWIRGCVSRLEQRQIELEQQAYEEGYNGLTN